VREVKSRRNKKKYRVLAIIPARGGSKGLPRKNIKPMNGKPLIAYSIQAALSASLVDRVVVSTEDKEIAAVSKNYGAEVPFFRPSEYADDCSLIAEAIHFTIEKLRNDGYAPEAVITLYPTHPFRTPNLIDCLTDKLFDGYSSVLTGKLINHTAHSFFSLTENNNLTPVLNHNGPDDHHRKKAYIRLQGLFIGSSLNGCYKQPYIHIIDDPISLIDIDSLSDFYFAEEIVKQNLFDFSTAEDIS
jgi:CMP-N-acetylneuraminic acid synthetase